MAEQNQRKMTARVSDLASQFNQQVFLIKQVLKQTISTAIPVRVDSVKRSGESGGALYVSATPLVAQTDADGNLLPPVSIPRLPYFRLQHGTAAIVCDPVVGDVGLAIFAQQDTSNLSGGTDPVVPGSFRCFDMSDGFYIGGFWGQVPKTFIHIEEKGTIHVVAPKQHHLESPTVIVNCETVTVNAKDSATVNTTTATLNASGSTKIDTPKTTITGDVTIQKSLTVVGKITGTGGMAVSGGGGATVSGNMAVTGGDVSADGVGLKSHVHDCPQGGTTSTGRG